MKARRLVATALMAGGILAGTMAAPATAATATHAQLSDGWQFVGHYNYYGDCVNTAIRAIKNGANIEFKCTPVNPGYDLYYRY
ncbi:hypothetical protein FHS43_004581 [Streptosporangium becharense]|uniref:Secreted protein n=1 Tax=Streptosporangium becharense TaxID=1816182 RepID=A0A7W9MJ47_9ACTN|nr:hypothetical protein [Streptosporangium becharense]MBB2913283.1 hypothetical protein [Streptosporangium becharense]MBB5822266.1 hypothetical protein [Streptosporangium becharense]